MSQVRSATTYLINVPQGRTVRLTRESLAMGFSGGYSDEFSICHMAILIGKDRISYTHADRRTTVKEMDDEIAWVGKDCEKILLYRKECDNDYLAAIKEHKDSAAIKDRFIASVRLGQKEEEKSSSVWVHKNVDEDCDGIAVTFTEDKESLLHKNLRNYLTAPENLLRHTYESQFDAAHKIEDILCNDSDKFLQKKNVIFDGLHWLVIPSAELKPYHADQVLLDSRLDFVRKKASLLVDVVMSLKSLVTDIAKILSVKKNKVVFGKENVLIPFLRVAIFFQNYLLQDAPEVFFLREVDAMLEEKNCVPSTSADTKLQTSLRDEKSVNGREKLVNDYDAANSTKYTRYLKGNLKELKRDYLKRKSYKDLEEFYLARRKAAFAAQQQVKVLLEHKKHQEAANVFIAVLPDACQGYIDSDRYLRMLYRNIGCCLLDCDQYHDALPYFQIAVELARKYKEVDLDIFEQPLKQCQRLIDLAVKVGITFRQRSAKKDALGEEDYTTLTQQALIAGSFWSQSSNKNTALHWALIRGQFDKAIIILDEEKAFLDKNSSCKKSIRAIPGEGNELVADIALALAKKHEIPEPYARLIDLLGIRERLALVNVVMPAKSMLA